MSIIERMFNSNSNPIEIELLYATIELASKVLRVDIDNISEDWFLNEEDWSHEVFDELHAYIVYNDYVSENLLHQLGINGTSDLIEFCYEYQKQY